MRLGIIGGSGLYRMAAVEDPEFFIVDTPWGAPSDKLLLGTICGMPVAFLPRHGQGHRLSPGDINYRANIAALKQAGCTDVLSISACGSFRADLPPGTFVLPDQYIDRTRHRADSFFGDGIVAHIAFGEPACARLRDLAADALGALGLAFQHGGTYVVIEGPRFSTRAESIAFKQSGADVIGMTAMPEAVLAREAGLCYQTVAMVTDFDAWHDTEQMVDVTRILEVVRANVDAARMLVMEIAGRLAARPDSCSHGCRSALQGAVMTDPAVWPSDVAARLAVIAPDIFNGTRA